MGRFSDQYRAQLELNNRIAAYYASIRHPSLDWGTFIIALVASIAVSLRRLGIGVTDYLNEGQWLTAIYWVALLLFVSLDSLLSKARHPLPIPFGFINPARICEKFATQKRAWQLLVVLLLPVAARVLAAFQFTMAAAH